MLVSTNRATAATIALWASAEISSAVTNHEGGSSSPFRCLYRRKAWSSTRNSWCVPSAMRFLRVYVQEKGGSMPLEALSAKASEMVPVGAMDIRCELRMPCLRIRSFTSCGRREAKLPPER